jgi:hypothetical protein
MSWVSLFNAPPLLGSLVRLTLMLLQISPQLLLQPPENLEGCRDPSNVDPLRSVEATQFTVAPQTLVDGQVSTDLRASTLERAFADVLNMVGTRP